MDSSTGVAYATPVVPCWGDARQQQTKQQTTLDQTAKTETNQAEKNVIKQQRPQQTKWESNKKPNKTTKKK